MNSTPPTSNPPWLLYAVGDKTPEGYTIQEVLSSDLRAFIFFDAKDGLQFMCDQDLCMESNATGSEAMSLVGQIHALHSSTRTRRQAKRLIAHAMARAFAQRTPNDTRDFFSEARAFILTRRTESTQLTYLAASTSITAVIFLVSTLTGELATINSDLSYWAAATFGVIGAFLSVLLRFRELPITSYSSRLYALYGGFIRMILGGGFGAVLLLLLKAGLLLTIAAKNPAATALCSILAGFSERFVPDLLVAIEKDVHGAS